MSVAKPERNGRSARNPQPISPVRGRPFEKGNGGRRPGSRNRTTLVAEALLKGEEVELVRKAIADDAYPPAAWLATLKSALTKLDADRCAAPSACCRVKV